jgi:hypothetical protein
VVFGKSDSLLVSMFVGQRVRRHTLDYSGFLHRADDFPGFSYVLLWHCVGEVYTEEKTTLCENRRCNSQTGILSRTVGSPCAKLIHEY